MGQSFKECWTQLGTCVVVKRLDLGMSVGTGTVGMSMTDQIRTEVEVLSQVHHVSIVSLLGSSKDDIVPCLVYVLMEVGSLHRVARGLS